VRNDSSRFSYTKYGLFEAAMFGCRARVVLGLDPGGCVIVHYSCRADNSKMRARSG